MIRLPRDPRLAPFVTLLWASRSGTGAHAWERSLPAGSAHLAFRACGAPLHIGEAHRGGAGATTLFRGAVVGGPRTASYLRDTAGVRSIGAQLAPGAVPAVLRVPADLLADRHTPLDDLWGPDARALEEALQAADDATALDRLEDALLSRLDDAAKPHRTVVLALDRLKGGAPVSAVAREVGVTPRTLSARFRVEVGLAPKAWARVSRLHRALRSEGGWAERAWRAGYCDQAHLCRDFTALTGLTPTEWASRTASHPTSSPHHLPEPADPIRPRPRGIQPVDGRWR